ncbi:MAG: T9SS type A sorting domain-containing protein [Bacteroidales bacterium]|nr:T9SS type A sorting domain-containing protein [Bacteroidales bacterium]
MRKLLFLSVILGVFLSGNAQKYAAKKLNKTKPVTIHKDRKIELGKDVPILPILKPSRAHSKSIQTILIGTSVNAYTFIYEPNYQLDANPQLNAIAYTHRGGGAWAGTTGNDLIVKLSTDFGYNWNDSVVFTMQGTHRYRYPNGIIHNPQGNTNLNEAYFIVNGPITDGSGWIANYYDSKKKTGENLTINHLTPPVSSGGSNVLERLNLSGGTTGGNNGRYYTMWQDDDGNYYLGKAYVRKMIFDGNVKGVVVDTNLTGPLSKAWKLREFSNASVEWAFSWNNQFDAYKGFVWTPSGCDSTSDWYVKTGLPHIWETWDGAQTFATYPAYGCWHKLSNLTDQIWPVRQSLIDHPDNPELWEYRVNFPNGSVADENFNPGVIDYQGNLHMLAIVEGMYSNHPDSLNYVYANQPLFLFDVYTTGWNWDGSVRTWDVQFIDTLRTKVVQDEHSPFGDDQGKFGWGHALGIATSPDKKVIFAIWTDTDPQFDTVNTMPEIKCRAWNVETFMATPVINFTPGEGGMFFFCNYPHYVLEDGNDYVIPMTFIDIYSEPNAINPQQHYFAAGLRVSKNAFTIQLSPSDPTILASCENSKLTNNIYSFNVSQNTPNPAKQSTNLTITLKESANVNIVITNIVGQKVMLIDKGKLNAGKHTITINTNNLPSGIYFYTVNANGESITKKMIVE